MYLIPSLKNKGVIIINIAHALWRNEKNYIFVFMPNFLIKIINLSCFQAQIIQIIGVIQQHFHDFIVCRNSNNKISSKRTQRTTKLYITICQSLIVRTTKGVFLGKIAIRLSTSFFSFCTDHVINYPKLDIHGKSWKSLSAQNMALFVSSVTLLLYQASLRPKKWTITIGIWESFVLGKHIKDSKKYRVI